MIPLSKQTEKRFKDWFDGNNREFADIIMAFDKKVTLPCLKTKTLEAAMKLYLILRDGLYVRDIGNYSIVCVDDIVKALNEECDEVQTSAWLTLWHEFGPEIYMEVLHAYPPYLQMHPQIVGVVDGDTRMLYTDSTNMLNRLASRSDMNSWVEYVLPTGEREVTYEKHIELMADMRGTPALVMVDNVLTPLIIGRC